MATYEKAWERMLRNAYPNTPLGPKRSFTSGLMALKKYLKEEDYKRIVQSQSTLSTDKEYENWLESVKDIEKFLFENEIKTNKGRRGKW